MSRSSWCSEHGGMPSGGKDVSQFGFVARFQTGLTKLLPHSLVMDVWMHQQKLK